MSLFRRLGVTGSSPLSPSPGHPSGSQHPTTLASVTRSAADSALFAPGAPPLSENLADIQDKNRYDVVLANPPFGGKERPEVQQNFPIRTGETAFLFLQHFIKILMS